MHQRTPRRRGPSYTSGLNGPCNTKTPCGCSSSPERSMSSRKTIPRHQGVRARSAQRRVLMASRSARKETGVGSCRRVRARSERHLMAQMLCARAPTHLRRHRASGRPGHSRVRPSPTDSTMPLHCILIRQAHNVPRWVSTTDAVAITGIRALEVHQALHSFLTRMAWAGFPATATGLLRQGAHPHT